MTLINSQLKMPDGFQLSRGDEGELARGKLNIVRIRFSGNWENESFCWENDVENCRMIKSQFEVQFPEENNLKISMISIICLASQLIKENNNALFESLLIHKYLITLMLNSGQII